MFLVVDVRQAKTCGETIRPFVVLQTLYAPHARARALMRLPLYAIVPSRTRAVRSVHTCLHAFYGTARCEAPPGGTACHGTARLGAMQHGMGHIFQRLCLHTLLHANAHDFTPLRLYTHMHACARAHACTHTQIHDRRTRKSQMMENVNYYEYQSLLLLLMRNGL